MNTTKCEVLVMNLRNFSKCLPKNENRPHSIVRNFQELLKNSFEIILPVHVLVFKEKTLTIELFVFVLAS